MTVNQQIFLAQNTITVPATVFVLSKMLVNSLDLFKHFFFFPGNIFASFLLPALKTLAEIITINEMTSSIFIQISCFIVLLIAFVSILDNKKFGKSRRHHNNQHTSNKGVVCFFTKQS